MIRYARLEDVSRMLEIYACYVRQTAISFEYDPPTLEEFSARFDRITRRYPWIVWDEGGTVLGYAYADEVFVRAAYQWDAELSIYLAQQAWHKGIGSALYDHLEGLMTRLGFHNLYAIVTGDNARSRSFHERRGYVLEGVLKKTGYKFGKWHDVYWYTLALAADATPTSPPAVFQPETAEIAGHEKTEPYGPA